MKKTEAILISWGKYRSHSLKTQENNLSSQNNLDTINYTLCGKTMELYLSITF